MNCSNTAALPVPLEEEYPEVAEFIRGVANGEKPHGYGGIWGRLEGIYLFNSIGLKEGRAIERLDSPKTGRNDPCHCGSGKKHKKCCGRR